MDALELAEGVLAVVDDVLVAVLPAFELGDLPGPLVAGELGRLAGEFELLPLVLEDLPLDVQGLRLERDQGMEQDDRVGRARAHRDRRPGRSGETSIRYVQDDGGFSA